MDSNQAGAGSWLKYIRVACSCDDQNLTMCQISEQVGLGLARGGLLLAESAPRGAWGATAQGQPVLQWGWLSSPGTALVSRSLRHPVRAPPEPRSVASPSLAGESQRPVVCVRTQRGGQATEPQAREGGTRGRRTEPRLGQDCGGAAPTLRPEAPPQQPRAENCRGSPASPRRAGIPGSGCRWRASRPPSRPRRDARTGSLRLGRQRVPSAGGFNYQFASGPGARPRGPHVRPFPERWAPGRPEVGRGGAPSLRAARAPCSVLG